MLEKEQGIEQSRSKVSQHSRDEILKREHRDNALDEGLEETFPASDPVALVQPKSDKPKPKR